MADGDDIVFFDKYGDQGLYEEMEEDEFDNGYYFWFPFLSNHQILI